MSCLLSTSVAPSYIQYDPARIQFEFFHSGERILYSATRPSALAENFRRIRTQTVALCENLSAEDMVAQSMPDASPIKWHLAHTTWFYETFISKPSIPDYREFHPNFSYLFNSYYETEGVRHARPQRGLLTRPPLSTIWQYRDHVDQSILDWLNNAQELDTTVSERVVTGLHHEMQHQELILTDLLHLFSHNPLCPAITTSTRASAGSAKPQESALAVPQPPTPQPLMQHFEGGLVEVGAESQDFYYDCEAPRHKVWLEPFQLANRTVSNREWLAFMLDGGYHQPLLWLSDGWACCKQQDWDSPLYWHNHEGQWHQYGLDGMQPLDLDAPVCHISLYEADAYARWAGMRLPTEQEWEHAAATIDAQERNGIFMETRHWRPQVPHESGICDMFGNVWEWTQSPYTAYPGFTAQQGALGEYNGKFMANQWVLRGGSCVTARQQVRVTYRNFFHPHQRWQFSGLRLAK